MGEHLQLEPQSRPRCYPSRSSYVVRYAPRADKWAIFGSLAYLILPIDIIDAKRIPIIGWLDEVASLAVFVQKMSKYITPEIEAKADDQLDKWFPEYAEYEMIEG